MSLPFENPAISPEELAALQRVFDVLCPDFDRHDPSLETEAIGRTLFALYQNGIKDEAMLLAEMQNRGYVEDLRRTG